MKLFSGLADITPSESGRRPHRKRVSYPLHSFWKDDNAGFLLRLTIIIGIIIIAISYWYVFSLPFEVSCEDSGKVRFEGVFRGICVNESYPKYHDLLIGNLTIVCDHFDSEYLQSLIGRDVTVICCREPKHDKYRSDIPDVYFNVFSAYITDLGEK